MSLIATFGIEPFIYFPIQHSFCLGLCYFGEELQGWFQYTIWRGGFTVKGSTFHLEDPLEEATFFVISDQPHLSSFIVAVNLQP